MSSWQDEEIMIREKIATQIMTTRALKMAMHESRHMFADKSVEKRAVTVRLARNEKERIREAKTRSVLFLLVGSSTKAHG